MTLNAFAGVNGVGYAAIWYQNPEYCSNEILSMAFEIRKMIPSRLNIIQSAPWNDYRKIRSLGEGAFAVVWLAERHGISYAIKETKIQAGSIDVLRTLPESFVREISSLYTLQDTNIVPKLFACYASSSGLFIVMEYFETSLWQLLHVKPITRKLDYIHSLVHHLHSLFQRGIQHRDIKPDNILVRGDRIVLTDYGSSRYMSYAPSQMTARIFVAIYAPPEVIFGEQYYSYAVDVWSLGMVFVELLSEILFPDDTNYSNIIDRIRDLIGPPTPDALGKYYDKYRALPVAPKKGFSLQEMMLLQRITPDELSFLRAMLNWDPSKRWTPYELLNHPYLADVYGKFRYEPSPIQFLPRINSLYSGDVLNRMLAVDRTIQRKQILSPSQRYEALFPIFNRASKVKVETIHLAVYLFDAILVYLPDSSYRELAASCFQLASYVYEIRASTHVTEYNSAMIRVLGLEVLNWLGMAYYPSYITVYRLITVGMRDNKVIANRAIHKQYMNIALLYGLNTKYPMKMVLDVCIQVPELKAYPEIYQELATAINWFNSLRSSLQM